MIDQRYKTLRWSDAFNVNFLTHYYMKSNTLYQFIHSFFLFCFAAVVLSSCGSKKEETESNPILETNVVSVNEAQLKTADIQLGRIEQRNISNTLRVNGKLDVPPQNLVSISAPFGGFLKNTELLQGKSVRKGERIAIIENPEYVQFQQDYLDARSQLEFLEMEYRRQEELAKESINAQKTLQQAKASFFSKQAVVNGLHSKLALLNFDFKKLEQGEIGSVISLYAPINGYVTEVNYNIGSFVNPTDVLFKIVDTRHLHAELTVFERDVIKIKKDQRVRFVLPGDNVERFATVYLIGREIQPDRTVRIHCHLDQEDTNLLPGMYLNAVIELGNNVTDVLPDKALVDFEGKHYVFIAEKANQFRMVEVEIGTSELNYIVVALPEGYDKSTSKIVVNGAYSLLSKMKNSEEGE
jgi:membrane fusion protein, heavy metal efflux system